MQRILGGIALLISLACFALAAPWLGMLVQLGGARALRRFANLPMDSAIGCGVTGLGLILLFVGIGLFQPPRPPA
jgi:hypothetical protein